MSPQPGVLSSYIKQKMARYELETTKLNFIATTEGIHSRKFFKEASHEIQPEEREKKNHDNSDPVWSHYNVKF